MTLLVYLKEKSFKAMFVMMLVMLHSYLLFGHWMLFQEKLTGKF